MADLDGDGDLDLVAGEHSSPDTGALEAVVYANVGGGDWARYVIHASDEQHDGMQLVDLDGDLDGISIG